MFELTVTLMPCPQAELIPAIMEDIEYELGSEALGSSLRAWSDSSLSQCGLIQYQISYTATIDNLHSIISFNPQTRMFKI